MSYTVLARKYRSQTFDEVVGQDPIAQTLKNAIKADKVAHAYLFTGTRGVGKTTLARILAKALNCLSADAPTTEPCCKCQSCIAVNNGDDIDVIEIDGASNNGVEEVRRLRENAIYRPARARHKIYIIDEVHMLSTSAFNALLKILEEPPSHVKFIFATTEPGKVIATIQSRCQRFDFKNINAAKIAGQLKSILAKEKIKYEEDLILPLAKMANGSMRDALSLLDRLISSGAKTLTSGLLEEYLGCPSSEQIFTLADKIGQNDASGTLTAVKNLVDGGLGETQIIDWLIDLFRDLMVAKSVGSESELLILTAEQRHKVKELSEKFDVAGLVYNITTLEKLRWSLKNSENGRTLLEACLLRLALSEHFLNVGELLSNSSKTTSRRLKKNRINEQSKPGKTPNDVNHTVDESPCIKTPNDLSSLKNNWQDTLQAIAAEAGNGTIGLLNAAVPTRFENNILTLSFPSSAKIQKQMCEQKNRIEAIQSLLSQKWQVPVKIKLELAAGEETTKQTSPAKANKNIRNELMNDPAVKTVLVGLDARITNIEEGSLG